MNPRRSLWDAAHTGAVLLASLCLGCKRDVQPAPAPAPSAQPATNRVDVGPTVRNNLGISFAKVERRAVARTLRLPGRFELLPTARREYRESAPGTVELLVTQYQSVSAGTPLYRFESARWREVQRELADAHEALQRTRAEADSIAPLMEAHERHHIELQKTVDLRMARLATLEQLKAGGGVRGEDLAQAQAALAAASSDLAETYEKEATLQARKVQAEVAVEAANSRWSILLGAAATMTRLSGAELTARGDDGAPRWRSMNTLEVRAVSPGVVDVIHVASGGLVEQHAPILTTVSPNQVRFRAAGMQSDLHRLAPGQRAAVVPAGSDAIALVSGTITVAPIADPERRTIDIIHTPESATDAAWTRAGVAAFLEVVVEGNQSEELAIPLRCVARDGTQTIIFRRDPADPDKVIRMQADLGVDDGRWVVIKSGVAEGNEIVLDGVYQLLVATSGTITKGGHFHPDGTFHEGED